MALYNLVRRTQSQTPTEFDTPWAAFDPSGMKLTYQMDDNAFTFGSITNVGGKARLNINFTTPNNPSAGDRVTITGTLAGTYRVLDVDFTNPGSEWILIDLAYTVDSSGTGKVVFEGWVWSLNIADTLLGTYIQAGTFKIRPDNDGFFTINLAGYIQGSFPRITKESFADIENVKGLSLYFNIKDQTFADAYEGNALVFRGCDWTRINENGFIQPDSDYFIQYNGENQIASFFDGDVKLTTIVQGAGNPNSNFIIQADVPCGDNLKGYLLGWLNRSGLFQSAWFVGDAGEEWREGDNIEAIDENGVSYWTKIGQNNYDVVEVTTGAVSFEMIQALWPIRTSIQVFELSAGGDFLDSLTWAYIQIDRGSFVKYQLTATKWEMRFKFKYSQQRPIQTQ